MAMTSPEQPFRAPTALADSDARFRAVIQNSRDVIGLLSTDGTILWASPNAEEMLGHAPEALVGRGAFDLLHPDDVAPALERLAQVLVAEDPVDPIQVRVRHGDGLWVHVEIAGSALRDEGEEAVIVNLRDVGWRIRAEAERLAAERDTARLTEIFEATHDLIGIADADGRLLYFNRAARSFFEVPTDEPLEDLPRIDLVDIFTSESVSTLARDVEPTLRRVGIWSGELDVRQPDGDRTPVLAQFLVHYDDGGEIEYFSGILRDISERKAFEHRLAHQATHDPLTNLPNRILLIDKLEVALRRARRWGTRLAVLFVDLDHFKVVNDSLGHGVGDRLLVDIAARLGEAIRPGDTIARFGGDEFVLLCENLDGEADAIAIAERVTRALSGPFRLVTAGNDTELHIGLSIGIAFSDDAGEAEPETLIRDADAAMYRAKERGRGRYEIFDGAMRAHVVDRLDVEAALRRAIERRELRVHYQPIVDLGTGRITGVESLLRWEHSERGLLLPRDFITIAEETGLIVPIGAWVLTQACRDVQRWTAASDDLAELVATVNVSGRQLTHPGLVAEVEAALVETGVAPGRIELEITESVLMDDAELSAATLARLRGLGVRIVVDDFGTGYSSLAYLRQFPVDGLKVDRSFVDGLGLEPGDSAIVAAIVNLAHTLGLRAVAEGVETAEQLAELRHLGCDLAQGFHLARPMTGEALIALFAEAPVF